MCCLIAANAFKSRRIFYLAISFSYFKQFVLHYFFKLLWLLLLEKIEFALKLC